MTIIKPKQSNYTAPRLQRDARFVWAAGAKPYSDTPREYWAYVILAAVSCLCGVLIGVML